jgi:hypothetical protein
MKKHVQLVVTTGFWMIWLFPVFSQEQRLKAVEKSSVMPVQQIAIPHPNIPEATRKPIYPASTYFAADSAKNAATAAHYISSVEKKGQDRVAAAKIPAPAGELKTQENAEQPVFANFRVTAVNEQPTPNAAVSIETAPRKMVSVKKQPSDNVPANVPVQPGTLSPSKRKYLETIVKQLEEEIGSVGDDVELKKKELEDLKKLLSQ